MRLLSVELNEHRAEMTSYFVCIGVHLSNHVLLLTNYSNPTLPARIQSSRYSSAPTCVQFHTKESIWWHYLYCSSRNPVPTNEEHRGDSMTVHRSVGFIVLDIQLTQSRRMASLLTWLQACFWYLSPVRQGTDLPSFDRWENPLQQLRKLPSIA